MRFLVSALMGCVAAWSLVAQGSEWPQWRGPFFNGSTDETGLPSRWSQTENIAWATDLARAAASTPIVWKDRVFLSGTDTQRDRLVAICMDRTSGRTLWTRDVGQGIRKDDRSNFASASPATDGQRVVFFFGNGQLVGYDMDGKTLWNRDLAKDYGDFAFLWTFSSSPLLFEGKLYIQVLQRDVAVEGRGLEGRENESYLLAIEPGTGKTMWRHVRPSQAVAESREAFTTPVPFGKGAEAQLLLAGGDALTGHDPATGRELWRWGNWNPQRIGHWRLVTSPVAGAGVILLCAPKREPIYALKAGGSGLLDDTSLAWVSRDAREVTADVPTPAFYDGDFFVLNDLRGELSRVAPDTGKVKWSVKAPGRVKYEASPLAADGKVYLVNFDGQVTVFKSDNGDTIATIPMDEPTDGEKVRASVVAAHGQLFIRTMRKLYCVGSQPAP